MRFLHKELTYAIRGCVFEVHNQLGLGLDEESYQLALEQELTMKGIAFQSKVSKWLRHRGLDVHKFIADIIVEDKVILELKNLKSDFHPTHVAQIINYLKFWEKSIGYLVNFGLPSAETKRIALTKEVPKIVEDYSSIHPLITGQYVKILEAIRNSIMSLLQMHGVGYTDNIYHKLFLAELSHRKIAHCNHTALPLTYKGTFIRTFDLKMPLIENKVLCCTIATRDSLRNDILSFKTYLKNMNAPFGILVHFGKGKLEILGVPNTNN